MSINDHVEDMESLARKALLQTKALEPCPVHSDILIRRFDPDAEKHAYALGMTWLKRQDDIASSKDLQVAIHADLVDAAEECPQCFKDD